ncbi:8492_t:CDS:2 [Dentiscutata erythropus]|uniref:8492_t:CDS:1 n=1 Tax=Dentiscutata erythropus TaxID=1348616 RepID=A0A9N9H598_9GLOM|nr:8492_t:CDS:2 [Dentiscutata erythropus]
MPTIEDIIEKVQKNETEEEEPIKKNKPITTSQAIAEIDTVFGYIKQPESNLEIDIKTTLDSFF